MNKWVLLSAVCLVILLISCNKSNNFAEAQGGDLPTHYIFIRSTGITPETTRVTLGSTITFVNQDNVAHSYRSFDTITLKTGAIDPHTSYVFRKDTIGYFPFFSQPDSLVTGLIIQE